MDHSQEAVHFEPVHWEAYEYEAVERSADWYWAVGIITIALVVVAYLFDNILFGAVLVIGATTLVLFARRKPHLSQFEINEHGIVAGEEFYPYNTLGAFDITSDGTNKLIVRSNKKLMPLVVLPLTEDIADSVTATLKSRIPKETIEVPIADKLMDWLGF